MDNHPNWSESDTNIFDTTLLNMIGEYILLLKLLGFSPLFFPMSESAIASNVQWHLAVFLKVYADQKFRTFLFICLLPRNASMGTPYLQFMFHYEVWKQKTCMFSVFPDEILWFSWKSFWWKLPTIHKSKLHILTSNLLSVACCSASTGFLGVSQGFLRWMSLWYPPGN